MKKLLFYIFLVLSFLSFSFLSKGEESYYFRQFSVENGLPQNTVSCILQDVQGFMWFGTKDGLSRYDGYVFRNFKYNKNDKNSIGNNFIRSLFQDKDNKIWVGTDAGVYIYDPALENFSHFDLYTRDSISIEGDVNDIKCDKEGNLWFAGGWQGIFCYKPVEKKLTSYKLDAITNAWSICIDREDNIWIGTGGFGLSRFHQKNNKFETIFIPKPNDYKIQDDIYRLFQDNYNDLLIGTANGGVKKLSLIDQQIKSFLPSEKYNTLFIRDIIRYSDSELWIATESGIFLYDTQKQIIKNIRHENTDPFLLSDNAVYSLYKDKEGGVWIGTYFGGVNYYPPQYTPFNRFYPLKKENSFRGKRVREFQQDQHGGIWIGTEDEGLNYYDPQTRLFKNFMPDGKPGSLSYYNIHGLLADGDKLWVGTFTHGLDVLDIKTQRVIRHYEKSETPGSLCDNNVFSIYRDHSGILWIGTINGLMQYDQLTDRFRKMEYPGNVFIYDMLQSYDGIMWFASFGQGLFRYNPRNNEWKVYLHDPNNDSSICHKKIISIFEDSKKNVWFTTEGGGISRYNPNEDNFTSFSTDDGLPNNVVYKILEDDNGKLWISTNQGLSCFNPDNISGSIKTYTLSNGLLGDQFNYKSGYKAPDGNLYFGCLNGFISFNPALFVTNNYIPPVVITNFQLFNRKVEIGEKMSLLNRSISMVDRVDLKYDQSSFSIDFAALSYTAPEKNTFVFMLEGFDETWNQQTKNHTATYSNLPPGNYVFKVKASNSEGLWNETSTDLAIKIYPPFYKTNWAYFIYTLCVLMALFFIILSYKKKLEKRNERKIELFENEKDKELYNAKIAFFTNIAHEIRTPLSLIKGPLEHILSGNVDEKETKENLEVIERNTNRLLDLSNQLLDFRKMEAKGFQLNYVNTDIKQLINEVYIRFKPTAIQKKIVFNLAFPDEIIFADVDREALTKILSNLFSNAIKHAASQISITVDNEEEKKNTFGIKVVNDGEIVSKDMVEKIFEPFFQIADEKGNSFKSGTGLGLPLARSLAELHQGKLYLDTSDDQLNTFILKLPIKQASSITIKEEYLEHGIEQPSEEKIGSGGKPTLLIVEDDRELRHFLYGKLKSLYHVIKASHGKIALKCLQEEHVDIVITDIMMPEMDGLQLCEEIKSNVNYSHIPVIMLTAKAGIQSRIEGLEAGADAYVEKPFAMEHLLIQISNLFTNRNKVKQAFINSPVQSVGSIALTKSDENFLEKVIKIIHKNLSEPSFNVDFLADELNMSRSSLHRKIKGISELTPNDFIQLVRLKKAAEYLQEGSYRINETCFLVGFNSSSYFSKSFKKQFGMSPKEFVKK